MRAIDANVILRALVADEPRQARQAQQLLQNVANGVERVFVPEIAICDAAWVLKSFYRLTNTKILELLGNLLAFEGFAMKRKAVIQDALLVCATENVDFSDALIFCEMKADGRDEVYSFDRHFNRLAGIKRIEP